MDELEQSKVMDYDTLHDKRTDTLWELLENRDMKQLRRVMEDMNEFDAAEFLTEIDDNRMPMVFRLLSKETAAEVFANLDAPDQERIINSITDSELSGIVEELYVDDAVDMMEELPANVVKRVMRAATPETRALINQYLRYPENSAGTIMTAEYVDLKKYMNVRESFARIRRIGEDKETIYVCFVISADRKLEGIVTVKDLLLADDDTIIEDLMDRNVIFASTTEDQESVSEKFSDYDLMALPVVDKEGRLVGIVTVDDIIDVMEQETTEDFEIMAGMTRLVNLAAADGHPAEIMDMSFAIQALSAEYLVRRKAELKPGVIPVPRELDEAVARRKLAAMGVEIDTLSAAQAEYLGI